MNKYTIYCTEEQTKKALELGAPIETCGYYYKQQFGCNTISDTDLHIVPTAQQMIGWLEEQGFYFRLDTSGCSVEIDFNCIIEKINIPRKEATLAAINAALSYLVLNKDVKR